MTIAIADWRRRGHRGAHPASAVRAKIDDLAGPTTHVLHDISVGVNDCKIDHLIISPGGVFAVIAREETSREVHVDGYTMTVGDTQVPHLRHAKFAAERATTLLTAHSDFDVPVRACLVLLTGSHAPHVTVDHRPHGVTVLTKGDIPRFFRHQPAILTEEQVWDLRAIARRSATWA